MEACKSGLQTGYVLQEPRWPRPLIGASAMGGSASSAVGPGAEAEGFAGPKGGLRFA